MYNVGREATAKEAYRAYVRDNSEVPDYSRLKVYSHNESNKYILCVMIANQIALAQIDSGSHYTVISSGLVAALGLKGKVVPSTKRYSAANGETQGFTG